MGTPEQSYFAKPTTPTYGVKEIWVSELATLDVESVRTRPRLRLKDPENLTDEHIRLFRKRIYQSDQIRGPPDLEEIDEKLQGIADARSLRSRSSSLSRFRSVPSTRSHTPDLDLDGIAQSYLQREREAYDELVQDGGRPSHCLKDFGLVYTRQLRTKIIAYWENVCWGRIEGILDRQHSYWREFREQQDRKRRRYHNPKTFELFIELTNRYRRTKGIQGDDAALLQDRTMQGALEDWKEYQVWQLRSNDRLVKDVKIYDEECRQREVELQTAIDQGQAAQIVDKLRETALLPAQRRRREAEFEVERKAVLLEWIDEQLPIIASECSAAAAATAAQQETTGLKKKTNTAAKSSAKRKKRASNADHPHGENPVAAAESALSAPGRARPNTRSRASGVAAPPAVSKCRRGIAATAFRENKRQQSRAHETLGKPTAARVRKAARKAADQQQAIVSDRPLRRSQRLAQEPAIHYPK